MPSNKSSNPGHQILAGTAYAVIGRWTIRVIGLVNIVILARLLTPEDFGVVAMAAVAIGLLETLMEFGVVNLVIRSKIRSDAFLDTALTLQLLQGVVVGALLIALAPVAAIYFSDSRIEAVLYVAAFTLVAGGARSIGVALARKDLHYAADLRFAVFSRVAQFVITLLLVIYLQNYWGIIIGFLVSAIFTTILSYWMFPRRVRLSLSYWDTFFAFAKSIIPMSIARFLNDRIGTIIVGGTADTHTLGIYNASFDLSQMPSSEIIGPIERVLIPNYSKLIDDRKKLQDAYIFSIQLLLTIAAPLSIGLALVADDFVLVLLGDQWVEAGGLVSWLAIYALATGSAQAMTGHILIAIGKERLASLLYWIRLLLLAPFMIFFGVYHGVIEMIIAATLLACAIVPFALAISTRLIDLGYLTAIKSIWRTAVAIICMILCVLSVSSLLPVSSAGLVFQILAGGGMYTATLYALWLANGRPKGVERTLLDAAKSKLASSR